MITITPNLSVPPPNMPNQMRFPPPNMNPNLRVPPPARPQFFVPFRAYRQGGNGPVIFDPEFDGKKLRKSAMRKTVDYNTAIIKMLEGRVWQRDFRDRYGLHPDAMYTPDLLPPSAYEENPINAVTTRFVKTATNKMRCPIFCMAWTPEGRRLVTGASSGEFTLWNGLTFNFETILQAHDTPVRTMVWSHNELWMVTADHSGYVKYWQSNMNNVKMVMAHQEPIRGISFSPSDGKFASCSDDGTVKIWDFYRCIEERTLRGHGADVKCVHWHPHKGLVISGSKDNQQPVKLWDPKTGNPLATIHAHKSTVMDIKWNANGNWFVTASRDHLLKLFDVRNLSTEVQTFRGHKKEASSVAWHPIHEGLFASGGSDGAILFWHVGADKEVGVIEQAHDSIVWTLAWHPMGHILCSGSNDHTSKFWTRNRPGDSMKDKYNLNTVPVGAEGIEGSVDIGEEVLSTIPGMGPDDRVDAESAAEALPGLSAGVIPGLDDLSDIISDDRSKSQVKKVPYSKPIPKNFQAQWNDSVIIDSDEDSKDAIDPVDLLNQLLEHQPGVKPVKEVEPEALYIYGKILVVEKGSELAQAIAEGSEKLLKYIHSGAIRELEDVVPHYETEDGLAMPQIIHDAKEPIANSLDGSGRFPTLGQLFPDLNFDEYTTPVVTGSGQSYQLEEDLEREEEEPRRRRRQRDDDDDEDERRRRRRYRDRDYSDRRSRDRDRVHDDRSRDRDRDYDDRTSLRGRESYRHSRDRYQRKDNGYRSGRSDYRDSPRSDYRDSPRSDFRDSRDDDDSYGGEKSSKGDQDYRTPESSSTAPRDSSRDRSSRNYRETSSYRDSPSETSSFRSGTVERTGFHNNPPSAVSGNSGASGFQSNASGSQPSTTGFQSNTSGFQSNPSGFREAMPSSFRDTSTGPGGFRDSVPSLTGFRDTATPAGAFRDTGNVNRPFRDTNAPPYREAVGYREDGPGFAKDSSANFQDKAGVHDESPRGGRHYTPDNTSSRWGGDDKGWDEESQGAWDEDGNGRFGNYQRRAASGVRGRGRGRGRWRGHNTGGWRPPRN